MAGEMGARLPRELPVWSAPLVPVAVALTVGIVADRFTQVAVSASLALALVCMTAWCVLAQTSYRWLAIVYLWICLAGLASAYHHWHRHHVDASDILHHADHDGVPTRLRGTLQSAPAKQIGQPDPLRSFPSQTTTRFTLRVCQRQDLSTYAWHDVTGFVQVTVIGHADGITVGDDVELLGRLVLPEEAVNPGGFDHASFLRDQGITAVFIVSGADSVVQTRRGWPTSLFGWLAVLRGWGQETLERDLRAQSAVASALLLGEGSTMTGDDWEKYRRTGVLHALAISGQHLAVLAGFLWLMGRSIGMRRRHAALGIALFLIGYALLTGGRPPVMRAAWVVAAYCIGILLQRPVAHANTFALAWIGVVLINPTDIFGAGCQLSFLAVAVMVWGAARSNDTPPDPLQRIIDEARPWYGLVAITIGRWLLAAYIFNALVWLAVSPLLAAHFHLFSPAALLLGPPIVLLTSLALLSGFAFLLFAWLVPLAWVFASLTQVSLYLCELLVSSGERLPGAYFYVADVPAWWLWTFYVPLLVGITSPFAWRHGRWALGAATAWLALLALLQCWPHRPGELRCTFVAVGHGGCTVIETPGGRVIVYDAGATTGPGVTTKHIAPFLWSRGIRRIDDLILSHADLDHFNGVPDLVERFAVGRVITTPTFAQRELAGMQKTLATLERGAVPMEIVHAGQRWNIDGVSFAVLHPPMQGPAGKENARSLVLHVTHRAWSLMLTGDLEEAGLIQVLNLNPPRVDVLMAPHHGSDRSNIPTLAKWARPKLVVSSQAAPLNERQSARMYEALGAKFLGTWPHGAITIRPADEEAPVTTHRTKLTWKPR